MNGARTATNWIIHMADKLTETVERLRELLAKATPGRFIADTHHMQFFAGREHGFLRSEGELVPVGAVVLGVEGMSQEQGRARLELIAEAVNALPMLLAALSRPNVDEVEELRFWLRKAGEVLAPHSADAPGTPTRDALVFVNAGLNHHARAKVLAALRGSADNG